MANDRDVGERGGFGGRDSGGGSSGGGSERGSRDSSSNGKSYGDTRIGGLGDYGNQSTGGYTEQELQDIANAESGSWSVDGAGAAGGLGQGDIRRTEQQYLDSEAGAKSFYDAMNRSWRGNISDVDLSQYMDSLGTGYDRRAPLLGGLDAMATGRGGFGDFLAQAVDGIGRNIPGLGLLSGGIDIAQRVMNDGVVGGDMLGRFVGGLTGNPIIGLGARVGMNAYNGIPLEKQLLPELTNNAPMLAGMMGLNPLLGVAAGQVGQAMQGNDLSFGGVVKGLF